MLLQKYFQDGGYCHQTSKSGYHLHHIWHRRQIRLYSGWHHRVCPPNGSILNYITCVKKLSKRYSFHYQSQTFHWNDDQLFDQPQICMHYSARLDLAVLHAESAARQKFSHLLSVTVMVTALPWELFHTCNVIQDDPIWLTHSMISSRIPVLSFTSLDTFFFSGKSLLLCILSSMFEMWLQYHR